ncbi:hypothetical protein NPIL_502701 [Nephila pilipes]|uniref:Uncharacterized protein n=1 Tax=Nephila pilipes TaxID=299642 RepID=A0A8X6Q3S0_NEPPI|nr:hypothetical protein NPIL_502701 [Nephila pilipes]
MSTFFTPVTPALRANIHPQMLLTGSAFHEFQSTVITLSNTEPLIRGPNTGGTKLCFDAIAGHYNPFSLHRSLIRGPGETDRSSWWPNFNVTHTPFPTRACCMENGYMYMGTNQESWRYPICKTSFATTAGYEGRATGQVWLRA